MNDAPIQTHVNNRAWVLLEKARKYCDKLLGEIRAIADAFLADKNLTPEDVCFVVVGSVGRQEALEGSDIDLIPVLRSAAALATFQPHDKPLRQEIKDKLKAIYEREIKVSQGDDLTKCVSLEELTDLESIGGEKDGSSILTKRILMLTEGKQAGGKFPLNEVRQAVMKTYAGAERSRGRHVLSLCNDIARYYRTLCIEYKAKVDDPDKDWCTRNMKLRHSRKLWYFSCLMTVVALADSNPQGDHAYIAGLLEAFDKSPVQRLFNAVREEQRGNAGRITEPFAWFLEFMAAQAHRDKLAQIAHDTRYEVTLDNPFPAVKFNSDRMHQEILLLIDSLPAYQRHRILSWFLL
jgi:predicted nucleotidyltransferase